MAECISSVKPLNKSIPIEVVLHSDGMPRAVRLSNLFISNNPYRIRRPKHTYMNWNVVKSIDDMYKVNELWWRGSNEEINRLYFDIRLDNFRHVTIYRDLIHKKWYTQAQRL